MPTFGMWEEKGQDRKPEIRKRKARNGNRLNQRYVKQDGAHRHKWLLTLGQGRAAIARRGQIGERRLDFI